MLSIKKKSGIITKFQGHKTDTGSSQVQIAILTEKIKELTKHLKINPKDNHSRRGLLKMVARRKKLSEYLARRDEKLHKGLLKKLGLDKKNK